MKILLAALNAKYIHTCPAIYSLKAYAQAHGIGMIKTVEYTINDRYQDVLAGILSYHADVLAFSVYIWNVDRVHRLLRDIRQIKGTSVRLWVGGPEATWYPQAFLREEEAELCMLGEGEVVFTRLVELLDEGTIATEDSAVGGKATEDSAADRKVAENSAAWSSMIGDATTAYPETLRGLAFLKDGGIVQTGLADPVPMDEIPFLYSNLSLFDNRIIYYEASRGCPFACAYCLSGRERGTRYRNLDTVKKELQFFLDEKVKQVKFVDRTFNADPDFAIGIWTYIRDHDNGITNFHFEIEADRFTPEELELAASLRPGLIQMEIGVQSSNPDTLRSVNRSPRLDRIRAAMEALRKNQNINLHLDLIAGLPYEDLGSFRRSFQEVYDMRPHQLQLGFLKLLKGTQLYDKREEYGLVCSADAPYEVLKTKWLSYEELNLLHRISDRVEEYVNSRGFARSLPLAEQLFEDAFAMFEALADYYAEHGYEQNRPSVQKRYEIFADFVMQTLQAGEEDQTIGRGILEMIRFDQALHTHPSRKMQTEEVFDFGEGPVRIRFDHRNCSPVTGEALWNITL